MLFRNHDGSMIIINKYDYKNDELYYNKIKNIKFSKHNDKTNGKVEINYSNSLISNLLERPSNNLDNQK